MLTTVEAGKKLRIVLSIVLSQPSSHSPTIILRCSCPLPSWVVSPWRSEFSPQGSRMYRFLPHSATGATAASRYRPPHLRICQRLESGATTVSARGPLAWRPCDPFGPEALLLTHIHFKLIFNYWYITTLATASLLSRSLLPPFIPNYTFSWPLPPKKCHTNARKRS